MPVPTPPEVPSGVQLYPVWSPDRCGRAPLSLAILPAGVQQNQDRRGAAEFVTAHGVRAKSASNCHPHLCRSMIDFDGAMRPITCSGGNLRTSVGELFIDPATGALGGRISYELPGSYEAVFNSAMTGIPS